MKSWRLGRLWSVKCTQNLFLHQAERAQTRLAEHLNRLALPGASNPSETTRSIR